MIFHTSEDAKTSILRIMFYAFLLLAALAWGSFFFAYAVHDFNLLGPSLLGALLGNKIPDTAVLIKQSTTIVFTKADWGLPGVPMPRIGIFAPYPNATAAITAVLGALALLHVSRGKHANRVISLALELLVIVTLTITLSRATLAGWLIGTIVGGLLFGTLWRRLFAVMALAGMLAVPLILPHVQDLGSYRQYSTESRFDNYYRAIEGTLKVNPILGMGIKPREEISHIALGSHSTYVSSFTKGGVIGLALVSAYLILLPFLHWSKLALAQFGQPSRLRAEMRILFTLQTTVWIWTAFEDLDAPAIAAALIFIGFAFTECLFSALRFNASPAIAVFGEGKRSSMQWT